MMHRRISRMRALRGLSLVLGTTLLLMPVASAAPVLGDLQFQREGSDEMAAAFPPSIFPHWVHRVRYRCDACHDSLFPMSRGEVEISMKILAEGKACGACHDGTEAFDDSFQNCSRCHRPLD